MIVVSGENPVGLPPTGSANGLFRTPFGGGPTNAAVAAARLGASYDFWFEGAAGSPAAPLPETGRNGVRRVGRPAAHRPFGADIPERWIEQAPGMAAFNVEPAAYRPRAPT